MSHTTDMHNKATNHAEIILIAGWLGTTDKLPKTNLVWRQGGSSHPKWGDIFTLLPITKLLELNLHYSVGFPRKGTHQSTADELIIYSSE